MTDSAHQHDLSDDKLPLYDNYNDENEQEKNEHMKSDDFLQSCSYLYPILFGTLLILGSILVIVTVTRTSPCLNHHHHPELQKSQESALLIDHGDSVIHCQSINRSSSPSCHCPISMIPSERNSALCLSRSTRCLESCQHNEHCHCYRLKNPRACYAVTEQWISEALEILPVESLVLNDEPTSTSWREQLEQILIDRTSTDAHLVFSSDQRTASIVYEEDDDYLLNERWLKFDQNSTEEYLVYTQVDIRTRSCRLSSILTNGSINHRPIHPCPGRHLTGAPYYFAVACDHILLLWQGPPSWSYRIEEQGRIIHHHFQRIRPILPVLIDPFHRYYSLYEDLMIEVKNLNGDTLAQFFTDVDRPTQFAFIDQQGTLMVANRTHRQLFQSKNPHVWFDV